MNSVKQFQDLLIASTKSFAKTYPLSQAVIDAYYAAPRHKFVKRYRRDKSDNWLDITDENLDEHLPHLYQDDPIILHGSDADFENDEGKQISTISQQSLVLIMIELLKLESGHKVFELGAASGWNAALMGRVVGPTGKVVSVEIIPELITNARNSIRQLGLNHVEIIEGDGGFGYEPHAPYDRGIFTAGANDLPGAFYKQIKQGGLLLIVLKNKGGAATLVLMERKDDYFQSIFSMLCDFVPVTGKFHVAGLGYEPLEQILSENRIEAEPVERRPYWWGGANLLSFVWLTSGLRSFLSISEPMFAPIRLDPENTTFGLLDTKSKSLVVAKHNELVSYGSTQPRDYLLTLIRRWTDRGMPGLISLQVKAYPSSHQVKVEPNEWLVQRTESQFLWSLPK